MQLIGVARARVTESRRAEWLEGVAGSRPWQNNDGGRGRIPRGANGDGEESQGAAGDPPGREGRVVAVPPAVDGSGERMHRNYANCGSVLARGRASSDEARPSWRRRMASRGFPGGSRPRRAPRWRSSVRGRVRSAALSMDGTSRCRVRRGDLVAENRERRYGDRRTNWSSMSHFFAPLERLHRSG